MKQCNECIWIGEENECVALGSVEPLCPECYETTCNIEPKEVIKIYLDYIVGNSDGYLWRNSDMYAKKIEKILDSL